jgi:protease-4
MKLDNYQVELISQKLSPKEEFIRKLVEDDALSIFTRPFSSTFSDIRSIHQQLSPLVRPLANLKAMNDPQGIYASCLECLVP